MGKAETWRLTHRERAAMADTLDELKPGRWDEPSLCAGWSVQVMAAHILAGAEQTPLGFVTGLAKAGGRFNTMIDRDARRLAALPRKEIVERLRACTTTTNGPPGTPPEVMLGEIVVHGGDIRLPLGLVQELHTEAVLASLEHYKNTGFPVGTKKRIAGLRLIATDVDWSHGSGDEVSGPGLPLMLAMTGRAGGLADLTGAGLGTLRARMPAQSIS